jgi:hypothetical protein
VILTGGLQAAWADPETTPGARGPWRQRAGSVELTLMLDAIASDACEPLSTSRIQCPSTLITCAVMLPRTKLHVTGAREEMTPKSTRDKVRAYRARLRRQGLRPIQIWVPDVRSRAFASEARRQARAVAASARARTDQRFIDAISAPPAE